TACGDGDPNDCQSCISDETGLPDGVCGVFAAGTVCREADDLCDTAETCDGDRGTCPGDTRLWVGDVCRPAAGACDIPETCQGAGYDPDGNFQTLCPADEQLPSEGDGDACDTGLAGACAAGTMSCGVCEPDTWEPERCNGADDDCDGATDEDFPDLGQ